MYILVFVVGIPLVALLAYAIYHDMESDKQQVSASAMALARDVTDDLRAVVEDSHELLEELSRRPLVRALDPERCDPVFDELPTLHRRLLAVFALGGDGKLVCSSRLSGGSAGVLDDTVLELARAAPRVPVLARAGDGLRAVQSQTVGGEPGRPAGIVALVMDGARYEPAADLSRYPPGTMYEVLDGTGTVIFRAPESKQWAGKNLRGVGIVDQILRQRAGQVEAVGADGIERVNAFTPIGETGWIALAGIPSEAVYGPARALALRNSLLALAIAVSVGMVAWIVARRISSPIHRIAEVAKAVGAGRLDARAEVTGPREIAEVAEQFNVMLDTRKRSEELLRETSSRLQVLSRRLLEVQEAERRHLARELHDEVGQALTAVKIHLLGVQRAASPEAAAPHVRECIQIAEQTLQEVRNLCLDLRPSQLDDLGLAAALRSQLDRQARAAGLAAQFSTDGAEMGVPPNAELATVCFRVAQEALTNVVRHAQARHVWIELAQRDGELRLSVRDDGKGFDVAAERERALHGRSMGLLSMEERVMLVGGKLELVSRPGGGTEVRALFHANAAAAVQPA